MVEPFYQRIGSNLAATGTVRLFPLCCVDLGHWISWGPIADLLKLHSGSPHTHL